MPTKTVEILTKAKALISDESHWTKYVLAEGEDGVSRSFSSGDAVRFCAIGALYRAGYQIGPRATQYARNRLYDAAIHEYGCSPTAVNDIRGWDAVMAVFDLAIAGASKKRRIEHRDA